MRCLGLGGLLALAASLGVGFTAERVFATCLESRSALVVQESGTALVAEEFRTALAADEKAPVADNRPQVTFVGFQQLQGGGGRLFVHLTGNPGTVQSSKTDKLAVLTLAGVGIGARNNRYPLDLKSFDLPVSRVELKARENGVDVELQLRREFPLNPRVQRRADGAYVVELQLPSQ